MQMQMPVRLKTHGFKQPMHPWKHMVLKATHMHPIFINNPHAPLKTHGFKSQ